MVTTNSDKAQAQQRRRGRPRTKEAATGLVRRNLLVDAEALEQVRRLYDASSDSEAVRWAIDSVLLADEAIELAKQIAERGGPDDVYERTTGVSRLPVQVDTPQDDERW